MPTVPIMSIWWENSLLSVRYVAFFVSCLGKIYHVMIKINKFLIHSIPHNLPSWANYGVPFVSIHWKKMSFWWNFHHWQHRKLSVWQLTVLSVVKISSKWRHFCFSVWEKFHHAIMSLHYILDGSVAFGAGCWGIRLYDRGQRWWGHIYSMPMVLEWPC